MKEKYFQDLYEQIDVPKEEVRESIRTGLQKVELKGKKQTRFFRIVSVAAFLFMITIMTLGFSFPSFAAKLPIVGYIYELFENNHQESVFEQYGKFSSSINQTKESNGITITVMDAVYDGENITIAYLIDSDKDLGERPVLEENMIVEELDHNQTEDFRYIGNYVIEKINDHQYAVLYIYQLVDGRKPDKLHVKWNGEAVFDLNNVNHRTLGGWSFEFTLETLGQASELFTNKGIKTEDKGISINVRKMTETPISTTFYLSERVDIREVVMRDDWRGVQIEYVVVDNLGNEYDSIHYMKSGHSPDFEEGYLVRSRITTTVIHEEATSIQIKPIIKVYKMINSEGWLELAERPYAIKPIVVPINR